MRIRVNKRYALTIFIAVFLLLGLVSVSFWGRLHASSAGQVTTPTTGYAIDPLFKEFYAKLGGAELLGRPLTALFERGGRRCQFTEAVLMCYDPAAADTTRKFSLSPLGRQLNVREDSPLISDRGEEARALEGGFSLYNEFTPLYDRMYGALYVGRPLTQVRVNQANQRYEQFFENVGFYRRFDDPSGEAHLLPYGAYLCGPGCSDRLDEFWMIQESGLIAQPFELSIQRLGWGALGAPLAQPQRTPQGEIEQVYDNALLYAPAGDLSQVRLRPLVLMLNFIQPEALKPPKIHEQLTFYAVKDGLGHNVPLFFDRFIATHGGRDLSGDPLTEMFVLVPDQVFRQCFTNYCLDYDAQAPLETRVRLVPLGLEYTRQSDPGQVLRRAFSPDTVRLTAEEAFPQLLQGETQRVILHVDQRQNGAPMYLVEGWLTLTFPDLPSETLHFPPTDAEGRSEIEFTLPAGLANMSIIEYRACLNLPSDPRICTTESFLYKLR